MKISTPLSVTATVCSNWAESERSRVTAVQPSESTFTCGRPGEGIVLRPGMFSTVEPMINLGRPHVKVLSDGWTAVTRDRSLSAQFEHTVGVTAEGCEIFTLSPKGLHRPPYAP